MAYIVSSGSDGVSDGGVHVVSDAAQLLDPVGSTAAVPNQLIGPIRTDKKVFVHYSYSEMLPLVKRTK